MAAPGSPSSSRLLRPGGGFETGGHPLEGIPSGNLKLVSTTSGASVDLRAPSTTFTYSIANTEGQAIGAFEVDHPGKFALTSQYASGESGAAVHPGDRARLAIGHGRLRPGWTGSGCAAVDRRRHRDLHACPASGTARSLLTRSSRAPQAPMGSSAYSFGSVPEAPATRLQSRVGPSRRIGAAAAMLIASRAPRGARHHSPNRQPHWPVAGPPLRRRRALPSAYRCTSHR